MLGEGVPPVFDGLAVVAAIALLVAFLCFGLMIYDDLRRDLNARVEEDTAPPAPLRPYDQELDLEAI